MRVRVPIALVLAAVLVGAFFAPIQPLYASSDSMSPAIESGDLYFVDKAGTVHTGDVITFETKDGLVTHRVVGENSDGYVTKGDANPSTDQEAGRPVVSRESVMGTVVEVNGRPITIGGIGWIVAGLAAFRLGTVGFGILLALALVAWILEAVDRPVPERNVVYMNDVVVPLFIGSLLVCLLLIFWGASTHDLNYVASEGSVTAAHTVPVGESVSRTVDITTYSLPFTTVLVEANGVSVLERTATDTGLELLVEVPAQTSTGLYQASVDISTYPATLPRGAIEWLHGVHWLAAALGTIAPVYGPIYLVYLGFVDGRMPLRLPKTRWLRRMGVK